MARLLSALCLLLAFGVLFGIHDGRREIVLLCKPLASAAFIAVALCLGVRGAYGRRIFVGLCFAAAGDVALMFPSAFLAGLCLFLIGHLCYVAACAARAPLGSWLSPAAAVVCLSSAAAYLWLWPHLGPMRWPVLAYVLVITTMVSAALAAGRRGQAAARFLLPAGAVLFYLSDLSVAQNRFVAPSFLTSAWGLPAYYVAQLLLAWSIRDVRR